MKLNQEAFDSEIRMTRLKADLIDVIVGAVAKDVDLTEVEILSVLNELQRDYLRSKHRKELIHGAG